jgi:hypothetical protein
MLRRGKMKRSYSFNVEKMKVVYRNRFSIVNANGRGTQCIDDTLYMNKVHPYPRGKFLKITYTLATKTGEFIATNVLPHAIFFEFMDKNKKTPDGKFLNCLIEKCEWVNGTRFNRKVEVVKGKKIKEQ